MLAEIDNITVRYGTLPQAARKEAVDLEVRDLSTLVAEAMGIG